MNHRSFFSILFAVGKRSYEPKHFSSNACAKYPSLNTKTDRNKIFIMTFAFFGLLNLASPQPIWAQIKSFVVNSLADTRDDSLGDGICADEFGNCTLRAAVEEGRENIQISFGVMGSIRLTSVLRLYSGTTIAGANQQVTIDGSGIATGASLGIVSNTVVRGIIVTGGIGSAIQIIGSNNVIGGLTDESRNVISGNFDGIAINGNDNVVLGNFIGTDVSGTVASSNHTGIVITGGFNNTIGGIIKGARNVISGNTYAGILIETGRATNNVIQGNLIGTDVTGTIALGNRDGVRIFASPSNVIGGTIPQARNVISGNIITGISISSGSAENRVQGNFIGADITGTVALGNGFDGVFVASSGVVIGGTLSESRNIIAGNGGNGILISGGIGNQVQGNFIGIDITGTHTLGNASAGIAILSGDNNTIGGMLSGAGNIISGNKSDGLSIRGSNNLLQGNFVGTNVTGTVALGNNRHGILLSGSSNMIGGRIIGSRNVISGNSGNGVSIGGTGNHHMTGNYIGTDINGTISLGNGLNGVEISSSSSNIIGGLEAGESNTIAFNGSDGVSVGFGSGNNILSNSIFSNTGNGIDLGPNGVTSNDNAPNNEDADTGANNLQNFPEIYEVNLGNGNLTITYAVTSTITNSAYPIRIEFFKADDSGEGKTVLASDTYTAADRNGKFIRCIQFAPTAPVTALDKIVATATDANGNTSEFSPPASVNEKLLLTRQSADGSCEAFQVDKHGWQFGNTSNNMWPESWWGGNPPRFDYTKPPYPFAWQFWPINAKSNDFPDWPLFVTTFGDEQCYFDSPPGLIVYNPSTVNKWRDIVRGQKVYDRNGNLIRPWNGSCFGFAISSFLAFDDKTAFLQEFPNLGAFKNLHELTIDDNSRKVINQLWLYQCGKAHLAHRDANYHIPPTQTLLAIKQMFQNPIRDDRILVFFNQNGSGGHAVNPYKIEKSQINPNVEYIYIYDNNAPNDDTRRIAVNMSNGFWTYAEMPTWGGREGLFLMDPVSNYLNTPILPKQIPPRERWISSGTAASNYIEFYNPPDASIVITDPTGKTIGYSDSVAFNNLDDGIPIIPITGSFHPPIGYFIPNGQYTIRMQNFADTLAYFSVFTDSLIYSYDRRDALAAQTDHLTFADGLTIRNQDLQNKNAQLEAIVIETDHEKVFRIDNCDLTPDDSLNFHVANQRDLSVLNFGANKSYDLSLELASADGNIIFAHNGIELSPNTSHLVAPDWENLGQQPAQIFIDENSDGSIDDTLGVENLAAMNYNFTQAGWYLLSLPVNSTDSLVADLFPNASGSVAYHWNTGTGAYDATPKIGSEKAYWVAIPEAASPIVSGLPVENYTVLFSTPGWYMIGSVSKTIDFTNPKDTPDGSVIATFGWDHATESYYPAANLERGKGYWIAVAQACDLTVSSSVAAITPKAVPALSWQDFAARFGVTPPMPPNEKPKARGELPTQFSLSQNYPNPFNPETTIEYALPQDAFVQLEVYNLLGQRVRTLVATEQPAGFHTMLWDGKNERGENLSGGVYLVRMKAGEFVAVQKITLLR